MLLISIVYLIFISIYSINQYDLGFILSMVGRIKGGQTIYKDFDYVRPFFGIFLWENLLKIIPLASDYLILFTRILVIIESFFICHLLQKTFFHQTKFLVSIFLTICFLHTFPIMPWHTIDGILFSVIAIYFYRKNWYLSAIIFLLFAALTKQSFFIFAFGFSLIVLFDFYKNFKILKNDLLIFISSLIILLISIIQYDIADNFNLFLNQILTSTNSSGFYQSSIAPYLFSKSYHNILFFGFLLLLFFSKVKKKTFSILIMILFPIVAISPVFNDGLFLGIHSFFLVMATLFLKYEPKNKLIFVLLFLAWSSSISWGYNAPVFFIFILLYQFLEKENRYFIFLWMTTLLAFLFCRLKHTYLTDSILTSKYIFCKNIPAVSGLIISEREYQYISEAIKINNVYKNAVFLPASPLLDVINNSFPNRASWELDVEYPSWKKDFSKLKLHSIVIDHEQLSKFKDGFYKSSITFELLKKKKITKKTKYFTIYGN